MANPVNEVKKTGQEKEAKPRIKVTEVIQDWDKRTHPVYIRDEKTGKCYLIRFSRFVFPWESENRYISFGRAEDGCKPEMCIETDDGTIGDSPLKLEAAVNWIGQYTLHILAKEKNAVSIDGQKVVLDEYRYSYQLYNGDSFQVGNSTFTVHFNYFNSPGKKKQAI